MFFSDVLRWRDLNGKLKKESDCLTHGTLCPINPAAGHGRRNGNGAGPTCTPFSKAGKREGVKNPVFQTHEIWMQARDEGDDDFWIFENTPGYDDRILEARLGAKFDIRSCRMCSRHLGQGAARPRFWAIGVRRGRCMWRDGRPLSAMVQLVMRRPVMTFRDYFWQQCKPTRLTKSGLSSLKKYKTHSKAKAKKLYDLSQNAESGYGRYELQDESLPTIKRNSVLYSQEHKRAMTEVELASAMVIPVTAEHAAQAKAPIVNISKVSSKAAVRQMCGNGMNVVGAGTMLLVVAVFVEFSPLPRGE